MKTLFLITCFCLILGCAYVSRTTVNMDGKDVRVPFGMTSIKGDQINATVVRDMDVRFLYPKREEVKD